MANEEVLRLRTTVVSDEALANIRAIGREIGLMPAKAKPAVKDLDNTFGALGKTIKQLGGEITTVIPALGGLGLGAAGAAGAMAAIIATMTAASKRVVELKYASKELGLSERDIRAWGVTAEKAGVSAQSMMSGMEAFKRTTDGLKYNIGGARDELYAMGAGPIVQRMQAATTQAEKMKVAFRFKDELMKDDPSGFKARMFFEQIGLGADKARLSYEAWERAQARIKPLSKEDEERAQAYADALVDLGEAWDHFTVRAGAGLFPKITQDMRDLESLLGMLGKLDDWVDSWLGKSNNPNADLMGRLVSKMLGKSEGGGTAEPGAAAPGPSFNDRFPGADAFGAPNALRQNRGALKQRGSSLYHPSAFTDGFQPTSFGGGGGGLSEGSRMVKDGVFAALVDFQSYIQSGGGAGTGMMNASFGGSGGAAAGGGVGGGGRGGGGAASFGGGGYTNLTPGTGGGTAGAAPGDAGTPGKSAPSAGEVAEANKNLTGVGGYNFMGSARARAMGMDIKPGSAEAQMSFATGIPKGQGPTSIKANKYAGADIAGFLKDLHEAGAPMTNFSGVYANRGKRGGGGASQHAYGNALDMETGFGRGPDNSPALYAWAQKNPEKFAELQAKHHMRNLDTSSGASMHDWGHFEWTPDGQKNPAVAAANAGPTGGGGSAADRKTAKGSWFGNAPGWRDPSEPVNSPKSNRPGIALRDKSTMGKMFEVTTPDGRKFVLPQTDWGPAERTGRGIDITAAAGAQMGYTAKTFPTDKGFSYRRIDEAVNTAATGGTKAEGSVHVAIESNGTAAKAKASTDGGLWQKSTIENYKQMQPTSAPVGQVATR